MTMYIYPCSCEDGHSTHRYDAYKRRGRVYPLPCESPHDETLFHSLVARGALDIDPGPTPRTEHAGKACVGLTEEERVRFTTEARVRLFVQSGEPPMESELPEFDWECNKAWARCGYDS